MTGEFTAHLGLGQSEVNVRDALVTVLHSAPLGKRGGFVIFGGKRDVDYVQYALDPNGLELNWPTFQEDGKQRLPQFEKYLKAKGYVRVFSSKQGSSLAEQIMALRQGQYMILDDGLYCQVGRNVDEIRKITIELMEKVFGVTGEKNFKITLEPNG